jgi:cell division protein FtsB
VKRKQKIVFTSVLVLIAVLFVMLVVGKNGFFDLRRMKKDKAGIIEKNVVIEAENVNLYRSIKRLRHDPKFIENVARKELGMVGKDELIFKFKGDGAGRE